MNVPESGPAPAEFAAAAAAMESFAFRPELEAGPIRPPQRLAPYSYALGVETRGDEGASATGRLILLHDPQGQDAWHGTLRLVAYIQSEVDETMARDQALPEVTWTWLEEAVAAMAPNSLAIGGTVTTNTSVRFGDIAGPGRSATVELRASWTATGPALAGHVEAFAATLCAMAGIAPVGVAAIGGGHRP